MPFSAMEGEGYGWRFRGAWRGGHGADARTDANSRAGWCDVHGYRLRPGGAISGHAIHTSSVRSA